MAEEAADAGDESADCPKCPECPPGLPGWMATFSDLVTLLLTFFVLLLSFAKTETQKYEAALGSVRNAFGGNVLKHGEVVQRGKSADNSPTMIESQDIVMPFPIDFLTTEGFLDKHEVNRESGETLKMMVKDLRAFKLDENVDIYETLEGIKVKVQDRIFFEKGSTKIKDIKIEVFEKLIRMLTKTKWLIFIEGFSDIGEVGMSEGGGKIDAMTLSSFRAQSVAKALMGRGVQPNRITTVFYGDSRPDERTKSGQHGYLNRKVEFLLRKSDLLSEARKITPQ